MATTVRAKGAKRVARRSYNSPLRARRAEQTRAALVAAATRLFIEKGWAATGMRDIAREAGVALETLYTHFSSKPNLLQAVIDIAVAGDDAPLAVADRPEFAAMGRGSRRARIAAAAQLVTVIHGRTAVFARLLREAAATEKAMADALHSTRERQRLDVDAGAALIMGRKPTEAERDGLWAVLSPEVYMLLVDESGWSPEQYEAWVLNTLERVIPHS
jgi:AcrR family transcriptional regulator